MTSLLARDNNQTLHTEQDALDVISSGLPGCIFSPADLHPEFFDLTNQIAGNVLQKFVNYHYRVAIVVPPTADYGLRVGELIRDHRTHPYVRFVASEAEALNWLN
ncbi:MAG: DUF4180 domain-containing protein [Pseudomonadota bacterium]